MAMVAVGFYWTQGTAADAELFPEGAISFGRLSEMMSVFAKAGLKGHEVRGTSIWVPRNRKDAYLAALADSKLLSQDSGNPPAYPDIGLFTTYDQRKESFKWAVQTELARIICAMRGVENAWVLYAEDVKRGFTQEKLVTATVSVKPAGSTQLDEIRVSAIRHLVSGAIAGLTPEHVTVCDLNGRVWHGAMPAAGHDNDEPLRVLETHVRNRPEDEDPGCPFVHPRRYGRTQRGAGPAGGRWADGRQRPERPRRTNGRRPGAGLGACVGGRAGGLLPEDLAAGARSARRPAGRRRRACGVGTAAAERDCGDRTARRADASRRRWNQQSEQLGDGDNVSGNRPAGTKYGLGGLEPREVGKFRSGRHCRRGNGPVPGVLAGMAAEHQFTAAREFPNQAGSGRRQRPIARPAPHWRRRRGSSMPRPVKSSRPWSRTDPDTAVNVLRNWIGVV